MGLLELAIRVSVTILVLLVMARLAGPRQIAQMNFYDYVVGIAVGSLAGSTCISSDVPLWNGLTAIILFLLSGIFMSWLARKNLALRRFLSGEPIILIAHGEFQWKGLRKAKMNLNELQSNLRYGGYFDVSQIDYAILESTGKVSVLPKGFARAPKAGELNLNAADTPLQANVILDGAVLDGNLRAFGKDKAWLTAELKRQGVKDGKGVALATLTENGQLSVYRKDQVSSGRTPFL